MPSGFRPGQHHLMVLDAACGTHASAGRFPPAEQDSAIVLLTRYCTRQPGRYKRIMKYQYTLFLSMRTKLRNILYNYFRNNFRRVLTNALETGIAFTRWALQQHATTAALWIAIVASILTRYARASTRYSMHKRCHQERLHDSHKSVVVGCSPLHHL
jgi:hypothetical protein